MQRGRGLTRNTRQTSGIGYSERLPLAIIWLSVIYWSLVPAWFAFVMRAKSGDTM